MRVSLLMAVPAVALGLWAVAGPSSANVPTHGDVVHFDLNAPGAFDELLPFAMIPQPPIPVVPAFQPTGRYAGSFIAGEYVNFWDSLPRTFGLWHWETVIVNPNPWPLYFRVKLFRPAPAPDRIRAIVGLPPGWGVYIDWFVQDYPPEQGWWNWQAIWANANVPVAIDTSVTEDLSRTLYKAPVYSWQTDYVYQFIPGPGVPLQGWPFFRPDLGKIPALPTLYAYLRPRFTHSPFFVSD